MRKTASEKRGEGFGSPLTYFRGSEILAWYETLFYIIITGPYFWLLFHVLRHEGLKHPRGAVGRSESFTDLPTRDDRAGYVHTSDRLAKIERAQRK